MGKNVLVIGASGDIGRAIATQLEKEGYDLILHYHQNLDAIHDIRVRMKPESVLDVIKADLSKPNGENALLNQIVYPIHSIVFASGIALYGLFQDTTEIAMDQMIAIHVKAPMAITKALLPSMIRNKAGKIVFISSIWGEVGASHEVLYSAVKGAQNSFVKALAKEVGPCGIHVNAISPGYIKSKMNQLEPDEENELLQEIPLGRAGRPSDVANAVSFLLGDKSSYIQGEIIRITGGWN
ncbi:elongation factor P 5-aminopentanone reductase [Ornithinibacillus xuwenensis]|uniref:SDR family oxidoreductase n=1 Tax=Ornithinibacillus xuwenensis TaxID=3144668 RepID=A0ABU9XDN7_9BACI